MAARSSSGCETSCCYLHLIVECLGDSMRRQIATRQILPGFACSPTPKPNPLLLAAGTSPSRHYV
eukprot:5680317-Pleurochrysis_carterae.AAC.3